MLAIGPEITQVEIISESACSSCHAKGLCSLGEAKSKIVEVATSPLLRLEVGAEVDVVLRATMGHKAVWLSYGIPLVVLVVALMVALSVGAGELLSGLVALAAMAIYYFVLYLFRGKLRNEYVFNIRK